MKNCGICNDDSVMIGHECPKPTIAELIRAKVVELDEWKHTIVEHFVDTDGNDIAGYGFMAFKLTDFDSQDLNRIELDIYQDWDTEEIYIVREEYWDRMTNLTDFHIYDTRNGELYPVSAKVDDVLRDIDGECSFMDRFEGIDIIWREPTYIDEGSSDGVQYYAENHALIVIRQLMSNDEDLPKHYNGGDCSDDDAFEYAYNHYSISLDTRGIDKEPTQKPSNLTLGENPNKSCCDDNLVWARTGSDYDYEIHECSECGQKWDVPLVRDFDNKEKFTPIYQVKKAL